MRREAVELVHKTLAMDPAQGVAADVELAGVVADNDHVAQEAVGLDAAPQRALRGDQQGVGLDGERGYAQPFEMGCPRSREIRR